MGPLEDGPPDVSLLQFMKEFLSLLGFGEVWSIFPGYVGKIIDLLMLQGGPPRLTIVVNAVIYG